jgi:hypothetical protein
VSIVTSSSSASADPAKALKELREKQEKEYQAGIDSGKLTEAEQKKARKSLDAVKKLADKVQADGKVTKAELAYVRREATKADNVVYALVNNKVVVKNTQGQTGDATASQAAWQKWRETTQADIDQKSKDGSLTAFEQKQLKIAQDSLAKAETKILADKKVSKQEQRLIDALHTNLTNQLYSLSHNRTVVQKTQTETASSLNTTA